MIRLILFALGAVVIAVVSPFVYPVYAITRKHDKNKGDHIALHFVQWGFRFWSRCCGTKVLYKGLENLPEDGDPVVFVANHRSIFDVILIYPAFKGLTGALAKIELKSTPVIGWWINSVYGVLLDRKDHRQGIKCVLQSIDNLNNNISMLVFPEGTRGHVEGELLPFHRGTFKIATKPGVRIIPVAISGTGDIFDDHRPYVKPHRAVIEFCEPIETAGLTQEESGNIHNTVHDIILDRINTNLPDVI